MSEFERSSSNWDLHAIVKAKNPNDPIMTMASSSSSSSYDYWFESLVIEDHKGQASYSAIFNELEELCKPFSHDDHHHHHHHDQALKIDHSPPGILDSALTSVTLDHHQHEQKKKITSVSSSSNRANTPRRRRNKHKINLVRQATAGDHLLTDRWNWRKYGEKSIKGSRYPRSYYRCSSSGGCLARKQVEQSNTNPEEFVITYMGEHCHPYPTRRHSQAGHNVRRFTKHLSVAKSPSSSLPMVAGLDEPATRQQLDLEHVEVELEQEHEQKVLTKFVMDDDIFEFVGREASASSSVINGMNDLVRENDDVFAGLDCLQGLGTSSGFFSDHYLFSFDHHHPSSSV